MKLMVDCYMACNKTCSMICYESCRKSCANQALFLGPVVSIWRVACSTMHQPLICCCGLTVMQLAQQSGLPPRYSKWLDGQQRLSVVAGRATAIAADLRSLHSRNSW